MWNSFRAVGYNNCSLDQYRSRQPIEESEFSASFSWKEVLRQLENSLNISTGVRLRYRCITKELSAEANANDIGDNVLNDLDQGNYTVVYIINTSGAQNIADEVAEIIPTCLRLYRMDKPYKAPVELRVRPTLTTNPQHKIRMWKIETTKEAVRQTNEGYIIFTNQMSEEILNRISTVILGEQLTAVQHELVLMSTGLYENKEQVTELLTSLVDVYNTMDVKKLQAFEKRYILSAKLLKEKEAVKKVIASATYSTATNLIASLEDRVSHLKRDLEDYFSYTASCIREISEKELTLLGLKNTPDKGNEEIKAILNTIAKDIRAIRFTDGNATLQLAVNTYLNIWSEDQWRIISKSTDPNGFFKTKPEWLQSLLTEIFDKESIRVRFTDNVKINLQTGEINTSKFPIAINGVRILTEDDIAPWGIPNPHHHLFNCWGNNKDLAYKAAKAGNLQGLIMQVISGMQQINIADGTVFSKFVRYYLEQISEDGNIHVDDIPFLEVSKDEAITVSEYKERWKKAKRIEAENEMKAAQEAQRKTALDSVTTETEPETQELPFPELQQPRPVRTRRQTTVTQPQPVPVAPETLRVDDWEDPF